jgi:glucosylceramidase
MKCDWKYTFYQLGVIREQSEIKTVYEDQGQELNCINLYPDITYQTFEGFGGTLNEAAAYTWSRMEASTRAELVEAYYGEEGLGYTQARMSLDSCDACLGGFEAMSDPEDVDFKTFSLKRDELYILPFWEAVNKGCLERNNVPVTIFLSPWSPPAFMKTNHERNHGGKLKLEYRAMWAEYICVFIEKYQEKGVNVRRISVQNEPNATQIWDSCCYTMEEEKEFLRDYLHPTLKKHGLEKLELYIWDHNKERILERALGIIDQDTQDMITGVAFHWYSGDHFEALSMLKEKFPEKKLAFTEGCVEYSRYSKDAPIEHAQVYGHDIAGNLNHGAEIFIDWCVLLNKEGGPNHVSNFVEAPIMYDEAKGIMEKKLSYYYIGHFSKFIIPGSIRIGMSRFTEKLDVTAFIRPDGRIVVTVMNRTMEEADFYLRIEKKLIPLILPAGGIGSALLEMD